MLVQSLTQEQIAFLKENIHDISYRELATRFNAHFGLDENRVQDISNICHSLGLYNGKNPRNLNLTQEHLDFLKENIHGVSYRELATRFNAHFGLDKKAQDINYICRSYGLRNGKIIHFLTKEQITFLKDNIRSVSYRELTTRFNARFGLDKKSHEIKYLCRYYKLYNKKNFCHGFQYTNEMITFLKQNVKNGTYEELSTNFNAHFGVSRTAKQIAHACCTRGIHIGLQRSRFGPPKQSGTERDNKDGYIVVKTESGWIPKQRYLYEQHYGSISKNDVIMFADSDKRNFSLDNLVKVSKGEIGLLNKYKLITKNTELTKCGINLVKLQRKIYKLKDKAKLRPEEQN
jgi:hypothetical protein